jgi:DNA repair photolyase
MTNPTQNIKMNSSNVATALPAESLSVSGFWSRPALIAKTNFQSKSLSGWSFNPSIGCAHGCRFCYVPSVSTNHLATDLGPLGVTDPDADWGQYVFLRTWDEPAFLKSLRHAEHVARRDSASGHSRAVMFSSTTDPYQVVPNPVIATSRELTTANLTMVARALELIRDQSTLNVRILTRSPLAEKHFDLFRSFGPRLLFGMSVPTLRNDLAMIYEPRAPAPTRRFETLQNAKEAGLHIYAAIAPTYPDSDTADLNATMEAIAGLNPVTIFHEPINVRAENVARIAIHAQKMGVFINRRVFESKKNWSEYALQSFKTVIDAARKFGIYDRLHLWPDKSLGDADIVQARPKPAKYQQWLEIKWNRVSEWPVVAGPTALVAATAAELPLSDSLISGNT